MRHAAARRRSRRTASSRPSAFPEEFLTFMGLSAGMREAFVAAHGEVLTAEFWTRMQALHRIGEVVDIFPYRAARRLHRTVHAR
jgi:isocitrate dehydrogenase kinase/phosphatase